MKRTVRRQAGKLQLSKETLRQLTSRDLRRVVGGAGAQQAEVETTTCPPDPPSFNNGCVGGSN